MSLSLPQSVITGLNIRKERSELKLGRAIRLLRGCTHEVVGEAADVFAFIAANQTRRHVLWVALGRDVRTLCPTGLHPYLDVSRLFVIEAVSRSEVLWVADQALRADGGFCVVVDLPDALSLKESRRLLLAAEQGESLGLLIIRGRVNTSAAQTRWECEAVCSEEPAWRWTCSKGKHGEAGAWHATCAGGQNATDTLHLAPAASA